MKSIIKQVSRAINVFDTDAIKIGAKVYYKVRYSLALIGGVTKDEWYEEGEGTITDVSESMIVVSYKGKNYGHDHRANLTPNDLLDNYNYLEFLS